MIAKETEKNKRCTRYYSNDSSSASLAILASYSPLNARLDALLSPVFLTTEVLELFHHDGRCEVKGQAVWAWSIYYFFLQDKNYVCSKARAKQSSINQAHPSLAPPC